MYDYYEIDAAMAAENGLAAIVEAEVLLREATGERETFAFVPDVTWKVRPMEFKLLCGEFIDQGGLCFGYERAWAQYVYLPNPAYAIEFMWHKHDSHSGRVDLFVELVQF